MANFFTDIVRKALPDKIEYALGITPETEAMKFEVGEGLSPEQKIEAEKKIGQLIETTPKPDWQTEPGNFFAGLIRETPRSAAELALKATKQKELVPGQYGTPLEKNIQKFLFGEETIEAAETPVEMGLAVLGTIPMVPGKKQAATAGLKALKTTPAGKKTIQAGLEIAKKELEAIKGTKLGWEEVKTAAKSSGILRGISTRADTLKREAELFNAKKHIAALAEKKEITEDLLNSLETVGSEATDLGRKLNSLKIEALPEMSQLKIQIIKKLREVGKTTKEILAASKGVDFTNADAVAAFYRKLNPAKLSEIIDEYRYINLLSSPRTHITNAFTDLIQTTVLVPAVKLVSGGIDMISAGLTGGARKHYVREVPAYIRGANSSIGKAITDAFDVIRGKSGIYRPDISVMQRGIRIPTKAKILAPFQMIPRILEAADVFFRTMITAGEKEALAYKALRQGKTATGSLLAQIEKEAADTAQYYVFRKSLDPSNKTGQGAVLSAIDNITSGMYTLRKVPLVSWFIPFIVTPMNILKQGIEFSPLGVLTLAKNTNKTIQLSKSLIGSMVFAGAGYMAAQDKTTWAAPTDEKERKLFFASGKQAYSMKIGNYWVSYSRLGPLAYPIAMAASFKHYFDQNPEASTETNLKKATDVVAGIAKFFSDQSYVEGIKDLLDVITGDERAIARAFTTLPQQLIPLSSLQRWVNMIIDDTFRQAKKEVDIDALIQNLKLNIVGLSKDLPPYKAPFGEPAKRQFPITNALSPMGITANKPDMEELYELLMEKREMSAEMRKIRDDIREELGL